MEVELKSKLNLLLFGEFASSLNSQRLVGLEMREGRCLLAFLALHANRMLPSAMVADTFWPETGSLDSLHKSVQHLRSVLGVESGRLETRKGFLRLNLAEEEADVLEFDSSFSRGDEASLGKAIALYRGPLLDGWEEQWASKEREMRKRRYLEALKTLSEKLIVQNESRRAVQYLRQYIRMRSSEEWAWRALMEALVLSGERFEALRLYEQSKEILFKRIEPPAEMTRLYYQVQDKTLSVSSTADEDLIGPEAVGGAMALGSQYYVVRHADHKLKAAIGRRDSIVLVSGPRQVGKTSLLARGLHEARVTQTRVVQTDLQKLSAEEISCPDSFFRALGTLLADQLGVGVQPSSEWDADRAPNRNFESYLRKEVLSQQVGPLVWAVDEVDRLFTCSFGVDVFALIRSWHNGRALDPEGPWSRLTMVMAYATEAHLFISDLNQSPFNVGTRLVLLDFTQEQVADLNERLGSPLRSAIELSDFVSLIGGHPYLAHRGLSEMKSQLQSFSAFEAQAIRENGPFGDHLRRMRISLTRDTTLCAAMKRILNGEGGLSEGEFYRLRTAGVISGETEHNARPRCRLYRAYLEKHLQ